MNQSKFYELYEKKLSANLNYIELKPLFTENTAKNFLSKIEKSNLNNGVFDLIDYEKLIYIYINFLDNSEIKQHIEAIFSLISANLEIREKYKLKIL